MWAEIILNIGSSFWTDQKALHDYILKGCVRLYELYNFETIESLEKRLYNLNYPGDLQLFQSGLAETCIQLTPGFGSILDLFNTLRLNDLLLMILLIRLFEKKLNKMIQ
jgi:hypothetical protein